MVALFVEMSTKVFVKNMKQVFVLNDMLLLVFLMVVGT